MLEMFHLIELITEAKDLGEWQSCRRPLYERLLVNTAPMKPSNIAESVDWCMFRPVDAWEITGYVRRQSSLVLGWRVGWNPEDLVGAETRARRWVKGISRIGVHCACMAADLQSKGPVSPRSGWPGLQKEAPASRSSNRSRSLTVGKSSGPAMARRPVHHSAGLHDKMKGILEGFQGDSLVVCLGLGSNSGNAYRNTKPEVND
jgi:hypothetical protein